MRVVYIPAALLSALTAMGVERSKWACLETLSGKLSQEDLALYICANDLAASQTLDEPIRASMPNALVEQLPAFYDRHPEIRDAVLSISTGTAPQWPAWESVDHTSDWLDKDTLYVSDAITGNEQSNTEFSKARFYARLIGQLNAKFRIPEIAPLSVFSEYLKRTTVYFQTA